MNISSILESGANVQLVINALDLKEAFLQWCEETKSKDTTQSEKYLTASETVKRLGVDLSTLWRWDKTGYLKKVKRGSKVFYKESDIKKLMEG